MDITKLPTEKLKAKYQSIHRSVFQVECFGIRDLLVLRLLEQELHHRNINVRVDSEVHFEKA